MIYRVEIDYKQRSFHFVGADSEEEARERAFDEFYDKVWGNYDLLDVSIQELQE